MAGERRRRLLVADFAVTLTWVLSSEIIKIFVQRVLGDGATQLGGDIFRCGLSLLNAFVFAYVTNTTNGSEYNPLIVLATAMPRDFSNFLFAIGARIPAQVVGSVYAVRLILWTYPGLGRDPPLKVDMAKGALTEGLLAFTIVMIILVLSRQISDDFFMKTWIGSLSKLTLHILGSDLTGGCMNPASAIGWAFAKEEHLSKEHLIVYWLAPVEATLLAVWLFGMLFGTKNHKRLVKKAASTRRKSYKSD